MGSLVSKYSQRLNDGTSRDPALLSINFFSLKSTRSTSSIVSISTDLKGHLELYQRGHCCMCCLGCNFAALGIFGGTPHPQWPPMRIRCLDMGRGEILGVRKWCA